LNSGFSNLATLKAWLLPASLVAGSDYNTPIRAIGLGVAGQFAQHCNRKFGRVVDDEFDFPADIRHVCVPRFPIEEVTVVELRSSLADGFVDQGEVDEAIENLRESAGLVHFFAPLGTARETVRLTYTGGFWWNEQEPSYTPPVTPTAEDPDLSVLPTGATALPDELKHAWLLQCEQVWKVKDRLGLAIGQEGGGSGALLGLSLPGLDVNPLVAKALQAFVRYTLI
jgi:hypothetical protein